jgi:transposase
MDTEGTPPRYQRFVGVDIAATTATVAWRGPDDSAGRTITIEQSPQGFAALQRRLVALGHEPADILVVLEATGSYWLSLATALATADFAVRVINVTQAHHFAKALLKRAKTDAIDAHTLARLAALLQPAPWSPPPAIYEELRQRLAQRDALIAVRQQVRNQRHALIQGPHVVGSVQERMEALLGTLDTQIAEVETELAAVIDQETAWTDAIRRLQSIPGVGQLTAAWIVVGTLNCTLCATAEQATAYAGLAPMPRESGSSLHGRATIGRGGNRRLRTALYMATLSAAQHNPLIRPFYRRLRDAGKPPKVARCAAARKLLHLVWAIGTKHQPFDAGYKQQQHEALPELAA